MSYCIMTSRLFMWGIESSNPIKNLTQVGPKIKWSGFVYNVCLCVLNNTQNISKVFHFSSWIYTVFRPIFSEFALFYPLQTTMILCIKQ